MWVWEASSFLREHFANPCAKKNNVTALFTNRILRHTINVISISVAVLYLAGCKQAPFTSETVSKPESFQIVRSTLDTVFYNDQKYRIQLEDTIKKYGSNCIEAEKLWYKIRLIDSLNLLKVENILEKYGWPNAEKVGVDGNAALFLVIQHSNPRYRKNTCL